MCVCVDVLYVRVFGFARGHPKGSSMLAGAHVFAKSCGAEGCGGGRCLSAAARLVLCMYMLK